MATDTDAHYEVCIQVADRWEIHARYPVNGANAAIEEAKQLEKMSKSAVKVVREVYDSEKGVYRQVTVYKSSQAAVSSPKTAVSPSSGGWGSKEVRGGGSDWGDFEVDVGGQDDGGGLYDRYTDYDLDDQGAGRPARRRKAAKKVTLGGLFLRIILVIVVSLGLAALATGLLPVVAPQLASRNLAVAGAGQANALFVVFIGTFVLCFALGSGIFLTGLEVIAGQRPVRLAAQPGQRSRRKTKKSRLEALPELDEPPPEAPPPEEIAATAEEEPTAEEPEPEPEPAEAQAGETGEVLSPAGEQQKIRMMTFINGALEVTKEKGIQLDAFGRFGIDLYLAGAVNTIVSTQGIEESDGRGILVDSVQMLGTSRDMARNFADRYPEYLMQPRYLEMYESGRQAMIGDLEGDAEAVRQVGPALEAWRNPQKKEEQSGPLAVLFTDIVGSTNLTVTVGDDAAQYVVRTHNRIVRSALTNFSGREVKHTGDGIMASFATVSNSVEAAMEMQRRVTANNAAEGDIPLHLCIGINAGEPVVEDNDLFGVTVQLSARLCAAAESDEILVSEVVRGLCSGKDITFVSRGTKEMKGFKEPIAMYEVVWQKGAGNEGA